MYERYRDTLIRSQNAFAPTFENKLIHSRFLTCGQSMLFFNQSAPDMSFDEWVRDSEVPINYQLKINHALSLLIDSQNWANYAMLMEIEQFSDKEHFRLDLENFRIEEVEEDKDGLTKIYFDVCDSLHRYVAQNTRLRESLIRLIWSYLIAKELTHQARDLSSVDRITYLKRLTSY